MPLQRKPFYQSRKLWATVLGVVIDGLIARYPDYKVMILGVNGLIAVYVLGEAHEGAANAQAPNLNAGTMNVTTPEVVSPQTL